MLQYLEVINFLNKEDFKFLEDQFTKLDDNNPKDYMRICRFKIFKTEGKYLTYYSLLETEYFPIKLFTIILDFPKIKSFIRKVFRFI